MSKYHPVYFRQAPDHTGLSEEVLHWARNVSSVLVARSDSFLIGFVFRVTSAHLPTLMNHTHSLEEIYRSRLTQIDSKRDLLPDEELICSALQKMINKVPSIEDARRALAHILELYCHSQKKNDYYDVINSAHLYVNDKLIEDRTYSQIDLATDLLDATRFLEMCECATSARGFDKKAFQIQFYALAFEKVREVVGEEVQLRFELIAGYYSSRKFKDIVAVLPSTFKDNQVEVTALSIADEDEETLIRVA